MGSPPTVAKISSSAWPQAAKRFTRFKALPADTVNEGKFGRRGKWSVGKMRRAGCDISIFQEENQLNLYDDDDDDDDDDDVVVVWWF